MDGSSDGLHPSRMTIGADQKPTAYLHGGDRTRSTRPLHAVSPVTTGAHKSCPSAHSERWISVVTGMTGKGLAPGPAKAGVGKTGEDLPPCVIPDAQRLGIQPDVSPPLRQPEKLVDGSSDGLHPSRMTYQAGRNLRLEPTKLRLKRLQRGSGTSTRTDRSMGLRLRGGSGDGDIAPHLLLHEEKAPPPLKLSQHPQINPISPQVFRQVELILNMVEA